MRWWLYNILFFIGYMAMMPSFYRRMKKRGGYRAHFGQRFGRYEPEVLETLRARPRLWIHAVSVGEAYVAGKILDEIRKTHPEEPILLSTTSSTGYKVCEGLLREGDVLVYFPLDFPWVVRRALNAIRPKALVLTESELWPNILRECHRRGIPTVLMNGRISDRSYPRYKVLRFFFRPVLRTFREIQVQFESDRDRIVAIGADPATVKVTGTVKFDVAPPPAEKVATIREGLAAAGFPADAKILLGASTWPGEEEMLLRAYERILAQSPDFRLVLVPRHQERGNEVESLVASAGFTCCRRSRGDRHAEAAGEKPAVLLADTTGELFAFHSVSDLTFVGKTLPPNVGGQNMIEPCALGKPVVVGPHVENFAGPMAILRKGGALREATTEADAAAALLELALDSAARSALGERAAKTVAANAGALVRGVESLFRTLDGVGH